MKTNRQIRRNAKELFRFCLEKGRLDAERVRRVAEQIIQKKHRGYRALLWQFQRLVRLECKRHLAQIASAVTLQSDLREDITADLEHLYGPGLQLSFVENPDLIAGVRISVGSDVYDDSVRYRLTLLQKSFSNGSGWQEN